MSHPAAFDLERLAAGELGTAEAEGIRQHLAGCPACGERLAAIERERQALLGRLPPELFARRLVAAAQSARSRPQRCWRWALAGGTLVLLTAVGLWLGWPPRPTMTPMRWRGEGVSVGVYALRHERVELLGDRPIRAGDRLRFGLLLEGTEPAWAALVALDAGRPMALLPAGRDDPALEVRGATWMPGSITLDSMAERTDLLLVVRRRPFRVAQLLDELERGRDHGAETPIEGLVQVWQVEPEAR